MDPARLWRILSESLDDLARKKRRSPEEGGRALQYSIWHVVKLFLHCVWEGISPGTLYDRLEVIQGYRRRARLPNRLISLSQFKKRMSTREFLVAMVGLLEFSAQRALKQLGPEEAIIIPMDLTRIESDPDRDCRAAWGIDSSGHFWGYKLGLITSRHGIVMGATLLKGNWTEFRAYGRLIRMAKEVLQTAFGEIPVEMVVCDSGFDGESVYRAVHKELGGRMLCPPRRKRNARARYAKEYAKRALRERPHRHADQELWRQPDSRKTFRQRGEIERVNGQLKDSPIRIHEVPPRRRGVKRLWPLCLAKLILYNFALNVNIAEGRPIRSIKVLVG